MLTVLSPAEFEALEQGGAKMAALTPEETQTMRNDGGYDDVCPWDVPIPRGPAVTFPSFIIPGVCVS